MGEWKKAIVNETDALEKIMRKLQIGLWEKFANRMIIGKANSFFCSKVEVPPD